MFPFSGVGAILKLVVAILIIFAMSVSRSIYRDTMYRKDVHRRLDSAQYLQSLGGRGLMEKRIVENWINYDTIQLDSIYND